MPWVKAADLPPPADEEILIYDGRNERIELGRYAAGRWYIEGPRGGPPEEIVGVTHRAPALDSEVNDQSDDD